MQARTTKQGSTSSGKLSHTSHSKSTRGRHTRKGAWKRHGQQGIDQQRAQEIQQALIREKYLGGEASGQWDQRTKEALVRYQGDHGWQTKVLPDSRALISLGLGPRHENLLNPEVLAPVSSTQTSAGQSTPRPLN